MKIGKVRIPNGFSYVYGVEDDGVVIQDDAGNQYVWIPEGNTREDGFCNGFFISRYEIAKVSENCYVSMPNKYPVVDISYNDAIEIANNLNARIMSNKQFERIVAWVIETGDKTEHQVYEDSSDFGNYKNTGPHRMVKTGYNPKWMCKNIDNLAGNLWTWTCTGDDKTRILRGGCCMLEAQYASLGRKCLSYLEGSRFYTGLRVVL